MEHAQLTCPVCRAEMVERPVGGGRALRCPEGHGVFLERVELGALVEAEDDWHRTAGQHTAPLPRITADMPPPPPGSPAARAWVESLFG